MSGFCQALNRWELVIGKDYVLSDLESREVYQRCAAPKGTRPRAILRPKNTEQVCQVVKIANANGIPLYPISGGKNWGLGSACAVTDGQVIVDLVRMNRIVEVNEKLAYVVVEPGVTQGQLYQYLRETHPTLWLDATGAGPDATIIGNLMERGFGHTPVADRFANACNLEVVLSDGTSLETGTGHYSSSKVKHVFKPGLGPSFDGIFTQSNLGIVTRATIWLMPKPQYFQAFGFSLDDESKLGPAIDALQKLRIDGVVQSPVHVASDLRIISAHQRFPHELTGGQTPLPKEAHNALRKRYGLGRWNALGALYGTRGSVRAARKEIRRALRGIASPKFIDDRKLALARRVANGCERLGIFGSLARRVRSIESAYGLLQGEPNRKHLSGMAWRTQIGPKGATHDPVASGYGFTWLSATLPMTGEATLDLLETIHPIYERYGFDPLMTLVSASPRAMVSPLTICYDKRDPDECRRATECYDALFAAVMERGYIPYRCGIQSMNKIDVGSSHHWNLVEQLKYALDPKQILAPGRYAPFELRKCSGRDLPHSNAAPATLKLSGLANLN